MLDRFWDPNLEPMKFQISADIFGHVQNFDQNDYVSLIDFRGHFWTRPKFCFLGSMLVPFLDPFGVIFGTFLDTSKIPLVDTPTGSGTRVPRGRAQGPGAIGEPMWGPGAKGPGARAHRGQGPQGP